MLYFIITIDTEGDNLWDWKPKDVITTENTLYLQRFQNLCNTFGYKPVWLSNYEMLSDDRYVRFIKEVVSKQQGEIGMHLHAWNCPPLFNLEIKNPVAPYLIEYPVSVMEEKIVYMTELIKSKTGFKPVTHRAGRWALNQDYINLLIKHGYKVDCSVTPHINWESNVGQTEASKGSNYFCETEQPRWINSTKSSSRLLEVPMTIRYARHFTLPDKISIRKLMHNIKESPHKRAMWLRPKTNNYNEMKYLINNITTKNDDYMMLMLHSSELMPGGSPTFKTAKDIESLYSALEKLFSLASNKCVGITLKEYYEHLMGNN